MSSILSCAHVHTTFCDGKTPAPETARRAYELGFVSLGFSTHGVQHFDLDYCVHPEQESAYRAQILELKKEYAGRMTIYLGMERDYYACAKIEDYEYFIASVHYLPWGDEFIAVDGRPECLVRYINEACGGDGLLMAKRYFALLQQYVTEYRPPIIGHFDLIRKYNAKLGLFDEASLAYRRLALDTLEAMAGMNCLLELNTGGMARGYLQTPYPTNELLSAWRKWGGEVIVNSDCHDAQLLDYGFDEAEALLRRLSYDHAVRLGRDQLWERFAL